MAKNPFSPSNNVINKPNRNAFDLSFTNHVTGSLGTLIPVLCKEVLPGDTFKIDSALGLRFMPLAFPIQSKCRAHVHFFYQRTKNLWDDAPDFFNGNDKLQGRDIIPPYILFSGSNPNNSDNLRTGSLGDYLNLPTVSYRQRVSDKTIENLQLLYNNSPDKYALKEIKYKKNSVLDVFPTLDNFGGFGNFSNPNSTTKVDGVTIYPNRDKYYGLVFTGQPGIHGSIPASALNGRVLRVQVDVPSTFSFDHSLVQGFVETSKTSNLMQCSCEDIQLPDSDGNSTHYVRCVFEWHVPDDFNIPSGSQDSNSFAIGIISRFVSTSLDLPTCTLSFVNALESDAVQSAKGSILSSSSQFQISALPFRCYESIYNSFYRDNRNNPLIINGKPVYNKYLESTGSGMDYKQYRLYNRNWEYDQFTSAVPSPQQGIAPLVGISSTGEVTFNHEGTNYTFTTETADDADTITKVNVTENVPNEVARSIINTVTSGISINDFRNVNAYQRWLETNIRRGLKYKDQALARWGVEPKESTLDMPEFIGGFSVDIDINTVTNTNGSGDVPLGDYAGQATCFGGSQHEIQQFCDQHGFIMAILSVVPCPVYTQLLPKMFTRTSALDYYNPEFGQIGLQAVKYGELCPLETDESGDFTPNTVFGYQRPWYEYIYSNDEAHGLFRTDFNQFLLGRVFSAPPVLGPDFLTVKESSLNNVFAVTNRHNFLGMVRFNIEAVRPIPSVSIPSL
jgi:capsid protein (F protein)|nr:MAG TPA: Major capsid protein [Microviridae sp.]